MTAGHQHLTRCGNSNIAEGGKVISELEITGSSYRPTWNVLRRELADTGFVQSEGAEGLLAWRLA